MQYTLDTTQNLSQDTSIYARTQQWEYLAKWKWKIDCISSSAAQFLIMATTTNVYIILGLYECAARDF